MDDTTRAKGLRPDTGLRAIPHQPLVGQFLLPGLDPPASVYCPCWADRRSRGGRDH